MIEIIEGADEVIEMSIKDSEGTVMNITDLDNIKIELCNRSISNIWKLSGATVGEGNIQVIDSENGKVNFTINRKFTKENVNESFELVVELDIPDTTAEVVNDIRKDKTRFDNFCKIIKSC